MFVCISYVCICLYIYIFIFFYQVFIFLKFFNIVNLPDTLKEVFSLKMFLLFFVGVGGLLGWVSFP